jgi:hypothetical protein
VVPVRASHVGLVCLADDISPPTPPCNSGTGPVFDAPLLVPTQRIRVGVYVNGSDGFNAFQIILKANSSVLKPVGIDLTGSVVSQPLLAAECLGTVSLLTSPCEASTADTLELAVGNQSSVIPTHVVTGLLFTAIYEVVGTSSSKVTIGFQTGCATSSVGSGVCVALANGFAFMTGTNPTVSETVQSASFNNSIPISYVTDSLSPSTNLKPTPAANPQTLTVDLTGHANWIVSCSPCTVALSTQHDPTLTVSPASTTVTVSSSGQATASFTVAGSTAGNYSVEVLAKYQSLDSLNLYPDTLVAHFSVTVQITDFAFTATLSQTSIPLVGAATTETVTAIPLNGFSGTVNLSVNQNGCQPSPSWLVVPGQGSSTLSCSWSTADNYTVVVTGRIGLLAHSVSSSFQVQDFTVSASAPSVSFVAGSSGTLSLKVAGVNGFNQIVALTVTGSSGLVISPSSLNLAVSESANIGFSATAAGNYTATATVTYGGVSHSVTMTVRATAAPAGSPSQPMSLSLILYIVVGAIAIVLVSAAVLVARSRRPKSKVVRAKSK